MFASPPQDILQLRDKIITEFESLKLHPQFLCRSITSMRKKRSSAFTGMVHMLRVRCKCVLFCKNLLKIVQLGFIFCVHFCQHFYEAFVTRSKNAVVHHLWGETDDHFTAVQINLTFSSKLFQLLRFVRIRCKFMLWFADTFVTQQYGLLEIYFVNWTRHAPAWS